MAKETLAKNLGGIAAMVSRAEKDSIEVLDYIMDKIREGECSVKEANGVLRSLQSAARVNKRADEFLGLTTRSKDGAKGITMNVEKLQVLNLKDLTEEEQEAALLESLE